MVDELKKNFPDSKFNTYFFYTHLPEYIFGFINHYQGNVPSDLLETIADTWEAFPKYFSRPKQEDLVEKDGKAFVDITKRLVDSPFLDAWTNAATQGVIAAAKDFAMHKETINVSKELHKLWKLSQKAKTGEFTGVLPDHTPTWSKGESWIANWPWGKVAPLK